jgi:hypothetical protein
MDERDGVFNGAVCVTERLDLFIRSPAIADDSSAGFDPSTYSIHQCVGSAIRYGKRECYTGFTFHIASHPLTPNKVSPIIFTPSELALVDFNGPVRAADPLRAAL